MRTTPIAVAALAVLALLVGAGAAAATPGNADSNAPDDPGQGQAGPPTDLPGQVPEFVEDIHRSIGAFLDGTIEDLGASVSELTPAENADERAETGNATDADGR